MAAGIMVSASTGAMNSVLGKLTTLMEDEFSRLRDLRKEVSSMSEELMCMKDLFQRLADVDELDPQTKRWRDTLREISYDIENIIDDFMRKIGKQNENDGLVEKTILLFRKWRAHHQTAGQIEEIKKLLCKISGQRKRYKLDIPPSSDVIVDPRAVFLYANAASLVGLEGPKNDLVSWLKDEQKQLKVVSIVGFGGLGKTTLANEVRGTLEKEFDCTAFVPVSQKPNITQLFHSLISQLQIEASNHASELHCLIGKLREYLQSKRYLIIIDDVWDVSSWNIIICAFPENDLGSRVIATTTRIQNVAEACCSQCHDYLFKMKPLSKEDSRKLFFGRIFGSEDACPQQLRDVSVKILKKCDGLPLAITIISSMLASKASNQQEKWEHVHNSLEDWAIERCDLERQWMAEGFVSKENEKVAEKVARSYFNELVNRSLIQPAGFDEIGSVTHCKAHDMMLDLILRKCEEENLLTIVDDPQVLTKPDIKVRRLSLRLDAASNETMLPGNVNMSQVRTVMIFGNSQNMPPLPEFKFLRVLHVYLYRARVDLTGLCKMYQLRYLKIRCLYPYKLPTQIRGLQHLETLSLDERCSNIPSDIVHLPCLLFCYLGRHGLHDGISNMKSLQYLNFILHMNSLDNIEGLGELTNLRNLTVVCCDNPLDREGQMDALCSSLGKICTSLECLSLNMDRCTDGLMALSPPPRRLERLHIGYYSFSRVPSWVGELHNLKVLNLTVRVLPKDDVGILAELPALTHLNLHIKVILREMIVIYGGAFPVLKRFELCSSSSSYLTFQAGAMPMLQRLSLMFNANGSEQNGPGPAGIQHLSALEELAADICCTDATESDKTSAESALRSAIDVHPTHLRVEISCSNILVLDFDPSEDEDSD